jgi:Starch-binding associating with outer membrane
MKNILLLLLSLCFAMSCSKDFGDINEDSKNPRTVTPEGLFVNASKQMVDAMASPNVNENIFRLISQYWTETTYLDEVRYDLASRNIPQNLWNKVYTGVLFNLSQAQVIIPTQSVNLVPLAVQKNQNSCCEILSVYGNSVLINTFGNIPYSQALDVNNRKPAYDDAKTVYTNLLERLDKAITAIDVSNDGFGKSDIINGGDMEKWVKFGKSLRLKMAMVIADSDPATAKTIVEALARDVITENADNIYLKYLSSPPNTNPVWVDLVQSARKDFVAANTIVDYMLGVNDPRVPLYFTLDKAGAYSGGIYGSLNTFSKYSKPSAKVKAADAPGFLVDASEMLFFLAEAAERGMVVDGTAEELYNKAIRASIEKWGGSDADADAYLAQPSVAYTTATGDWKTKIGNQKWIALYDRGFDAWTEWRRLDAPVLNVPDTKTYADIPRRYTYPAQEQSLNLDNYTSASAAIGGDDVKTKLWWDKF